MKIKSIHINNFKSLVDFKLIEPNPFTVFVGPNGSGKSNIFGALEFLNFAYKYSGTAAFEVFGVTNIMSRKNLNEINKKIQKDISTSSQKISFDELASPHEIFIKLFTEKNGFAFTGGFGFLNYASNTTIDEAQKKMPDFKQSIEFFSRIFVGNEKLRKQNTFSDTLLNIDASNLENVLKRLLESDQTKQELIDWLQIFIPEFEKIEIHSSSLSGKNELAIFEKSLQQPLTKNLISDGTYNILSLLTAVFQSDEPQFLCIEEPENGLHPYVIRELVKFFRQQCEEKGHYIWLNTHSQTLVSELKAEEIITVWKEDGTTKVKQHRGEDLYNLTMDEAWLSNALGGGVPW